MDDQTEVASERYVVLYAKNGKEQATEPETYQEATERAEDMSGKEDTQVLSVMTEQGYQLHLAQSYQQAQREKVNEDVDASLEEPGIGAFSVFPDEPTGEQMADWEKSLEEEASEPAKASADLSWHNSQNRHTALDHAMKLATIPMGGMIVQTSGPDAEHVVKNARIFLAFLNEEGAGA